MPYRSKALVVFVGDKSTPGSDPYSMDCVYGDLSHASGTAPWTLQPWSLSAACGSGVGSASPATSRAVSAGPDGRIWFAWTNSSTNIVSVVRTNKADTVFGRVERYKSPCGSEGFVGLSGGNWGRVDVGLQCLVRAGAPLDDFVTQSITALAVSPRSRTISNRSAHKLVFKVADAGEPVKGAVVKVDGHAAKTGSAGRATITNPKGVRPGTFTVTASALNYIPARGTLVIVR